MAGQDNQDRRSVATSNTCQGTLCPPARKKLAVGINDTHGGLQQLLLLLRQLRCRGGAAPRRGWLAGPLLRQFSRGESAAHPAVPSADATAAVASGRREGHDRLKVRLYGQEKPPHAWPHPNVRLTLWVAFLLLLLLIATPSDGYGILKLDLFAERWLRPAAGQGPRSCARHSLGELTRGDACTVPLILLVLAVATAEARAGA